MFPAKPHLLELLPYQQAISGHMRSGLLLRFLCCLLVAILCYSLMPPTLLRADNLLVTHVIRYHMPEVDEVVLVWGIDGWGAVPEEIRPAGTTVDGDRAMSTPMVREGDAFVARVQVPLNAHIDYGFWITKLRNGAEVGIWDFQPGSITARPGGMTNVRLVMQEIRYYMPQASQVSLVWSTNDWALDTFEMTRPEGTVMKDGLIYTPMGRDGDTFVTRLRVPAGATIDYRFLRTDRHGDSIVESRDTNGGAGYRTIAIAAGVAGVNGTLLEGSAQPFSAILQVGLYLLGGIVVILSIGLILYFAPLQSPPSIAVVLFSLTLLGLGLRLWVGWDLNQQLPNTPDRLSSHELAYDQLVYAVRDGTFFQQSSRMSIYPFFLAICYHLFGHSYATILYVQAFIGVLAIPLTFLLARRFTGPKLSLFAAALIALHPTLTLHLTRLSDEVLYTPLLLLTLLSLLWALKKPHLLRFMLAGVPLAAANLCQPIAALFPLFLLLLLPRTRNLRSKVMLCLAYASATIIILVPWNYQNYHAYPTFSPLIVSGAALWQGSPEFFYLADGTVSNAEISNWYLNPQYNGGNDPLTIEGDRYFVNRALNSILAAPEDYVLYSLLKLLFFWIGHPIGDWPEHTFFNLETLRLYYSMPHIAAIFAARLLLLIALLALIIQHEVHGQVTRLIPLLVLCGYFMVVHAIGYPEMRYSEVLYPILVTIIVVAVKPLSRSMTKSNTGFNYAYRSS